MSARLRKKMNKELRSAKPQSEREITSDHIKPAALLSRLPLKLRKKEESLLTSFEKKISLQKKKRSAPHSKRTTPGTVDATSPPHIIHVEGGRWMQTLQKQTLNQNKNLTRKMSKKKR